MGPLVGSTAEGPAQPALLLSSENDARPAEWVGPRAWQSDDVTKTQYYTATSLDGYIADEHNSLDWLFEVDRAEGDDQSFTRFSPT